MNDTTSAVGWRRRILATTAFFALGTLACSNFDNVVRPEYGYVRINVVTTGGDLDADGYYLTVDALRIGALVAVQGTGSYYVPAGEHAVTLQSVAENCVVKGTSTRTVSVSTGLITDVIFEIECLPTAISVTTRTTGVDTPDALQLSLTSRLIATTPSSSTFTFGGLTAGSYTLIVIAPENCIVSGGGQVILNVTSRTVTPVTFDVTCGPVTRSEKIAFVDYQVPNGGASPYLSLVNPDGTGPRILRVGESPSWSPDRTRLAFSTTTCFDDYYYYYYGVTCNGGIMLVDPETGRVAPTGGGLAYAPSWSPTGGALVLEGFGARNDSMNLHVLQLSTGTLTLLDIKGPVSKEQPAWSPDGKRIAFVCRWPLTTDLCLFNADGSGIVKLTDDAPSDLRPAWSPSGNTIAFARHPARQTDPASGEIVVIDVATKAAVVLTRGTEPTWSPDGSRLAFAGIDGLFVINANGTNLKRLTTGFHREPAWRP